MSNRKTTCEGCGCNCKNCADPVGSLHLHVEIENLKQRLLERESHIVKMETNFLREAEKFPNGEMAALTDELLTWQDKYSRLYEAHKRVQKVNQNLEDKLLRIVDKCETEKSVLTAEVSALTRRLVDEKFTVTKLQEENERYRNDVNLAIQLLQCKPSNFIPQKYDSLPVDLQQKVRSYVSSKRRMSINEMQQKPPEMKTIKVPIPTFPPTAMVYSVNKPSDEKDSPLVGSNGEEKNKQGSVDIVSAAIMAKVLEEREKERSQMKHCDTCTCSTSTMGDNTNNNSRRQHKETQTINNNCNLSTICDSNMNRNSNISFNRSNDSCNNSYSNFNNHNQNSNSKNFKSGNNTSIVSSPMNIKRCKTIPTVSNIGNSTVSVSSEPLLDKQNFKIDYFNDFNMSPVFDDTKDSNNLFNSGINISKHYLNDNQDNELTFFSNDIATITHNSDIDESNMVFDNSNSLKCGGVTFNTNCGGSNDVVLVDNHVKNDNLNDYGNDRDDNDDRNNLIIFDKQLSPLLLPKTTAVTSNTTLTTPTTNLTVLGGNLSISSGVSGSRAGSARHCSVRLQAGTSNILLDNVVDGPYAPVLYKSRQQSTTDALLVHVPPSRSHSASSSVSSSCNDEQNQRSSADIISNNVNNALRTLSLSSPISTSSSASSTSSSSLSLTNSSVHKNLILAQLRTETEI